jgi:hypothetical protein
MLPLLAGIAARVAAPMVGRVVGAQFAKRAAGPAAAMLSRTTGRNVSAQVAGRYVGMKAPGEITGAVKNYAQGAMFTGGTQIGRSVSEFTQGAQDNPDARQSLI